MSQNLSNLSLEELEELHTIVKKWGIYSNDNDFSIIKDKFFPDIRKVFIDFNAPVFRRINEYPWLIKDEVMASASAAFLGIMLFRLIYKIPRKEGDLDIDISIIMIYLTSDHVLDDKSSNNELKKNLKQVLNDRPDYIPENLDDKVKAVYKEFLFLTSRSKYAEEALLEAWDKEVESEKQHYETDLKKLWDISARKGGACTIMTAKILTGEVFEDCYRLGAVTQWMDDLCDMKIDLDEGIKTCATESANIGELDRYIYDIFIEMSKLGERFWIIKILFTLIICSLVDRREHISIELKNLIVKYTIFNKIVYEDWINGI